MLEAAGLAYTGSGVAASAHRHGQGAVQADDARDRPAGRRLARGPGRALGLGPRRRADGARRVRRRHRRSSPDDQAGRPRQLGRDDPRARGGRARRGPRPGLPLRTGGPRRGLRRRARATSRSRSSATTTRGSRCSVRARSCRVTSSTTTPRSTRRACPSPRSGPRSPRPPARRLHKLARDAYRAIGAEGFARVDFLLAGDAIYLSEINTIPGFTPISLFPTMPAEGGYTFAAVCTRIVDLAIERHAARADRRLTPGGPAAMTGRPLANRDPRAAARTPDATGPSRVGPPLAGPRRRRAGDAGLGRRDLRRRARRPRSPTSGSRSTA